MYKRFIVSDATLHCKKILYHEISIATPFVQTVNDYYGYSMWPQKINIIK